MKPLARYVVLAVLTCALPVMLAAQADRGTITGTVSDSSGAVISNAAVKAKNTATAVETSAVTNETGLYNLSNLPIGTYRITVSAPGFKTYERVGFELTVAQTARLDVALSVGQAVETVTVEANAEQLNTSDSMLAATIQSKVMTDMPLTFQQEGRLIESFAFAVTPGVEGDAWESHVGGSQTFAKEVLIDGISANAHIVGDNMETAPTMEAIQEFKVQTTGMSAEYGRNTGGTFNFAMKSGTNQFHGSGFYYGRNEALNANSWLSNHYLAQYNGSVKECEAASAPNPCPYKKQRDRNHLYGGSAGGPVVIPGLYNGKDRTFIFGAYEHFEQEWMSLGAMNQTVPTPAFLTGDFSALLTSNQVGTDTLGRPIYTGQIYDPTTRRQVNGQWVVDPFPGNIIPADRISPMSQKIVNIYKAGPYQPMVDRVVDNFRSAANQQPWFHETQLTLKVDHNFSNNNRLSGSFIWSERPRVFSGSSDLFGLWLPQFGKDGGPLTGGTYDKVTGRRVAISDNWTITPSVINTLSLAFNRYYKYDHDASTAFGGWPASQGLTQAKTWPEYFGLTDYTTSPSFPSISFGNQVNGVGETGFGGGAPGGWAGQTYILSDSIAWLHGKHSFKLGGEAWQMQLNAFPTTQDALTYDFSNISTSSPVAKKTTGFGFASFLLGEVDSAERKVPLTSHPRRNYFDLYFQDDWKATQKLTLNLGIRWEQAEAMTTTDNRWANFNLNTTNTVLGVPGAYEFASSSQRTFEKGKQWTNFAPRLGFAYAVGEKSVIRGAYGIYYAPLAIQYWFGVPYAGWGGTVGFLGVDKINSTGTFPAFNWDNTASPGSGFYPSTGYVAPVKDPNQMPVWGTVTVDPNALKLGYTHQYNISFEHSFSSNDLVQVAFVGSLGRRLHDGQLRRNQPTREAYSKLTPDDQWAWADWCSSKTQMIGTVPCPFEGFWGYAGQAIDPFPQVAMSWGPLYYSESPLGSSSYKALQITYNRRTSKGLAAELAYTFSKTKGNSESNWQEEYAGYPYLGDATTPWVQDMYNLKEAADTVVSYDQTHVFKGLVMYELPFGHGRTWLANAPRALNAILGGWTVSTIFKYNSGVPLPVSPTNIYYPGWEGYIYANVNPSVSMSRTWNSKAFNIDDLSSAGNTYFNTAAFSDPTFPNLGNGKRYYENLRGFGYCNEDFGLIKYFKAKERLNFQLRAEFLNAFNRHHFANPDTNTGSQFFGKVTNLTSDAPRAVQFGLRVNW